MAETSAFEIRRGEKIYRAASIEILTKWAVERRISAGDMLRRAGETEWKKAGELTEITCLLDPSNWWTVVTGGKSFIAPDFETVVKWTREGRLTSDAIIEGPRTPPGGVLAQGLPGLSPFLRPAVEHGDDAPPRLRIDGIEYHPGDMETIRRWIIDFRVPLEAEISLSGGSWEPISECGAFEPEIWPAGAWGERSPDEEDPVASTSPEDEPVFELDPGNPAPCSVSEPGNQTVALETAIPEGSGAGNEFRIISSKGEVLARNASEMRKLLKSRKIHSFDEVLHPDLPEGRSSVGAALESFRRSRRRSIPAWILWVLVLLALVAAFVILDPLKLELLERVGISWT